MVFRVKWNKIPSSSQQIRLERMVSSTSHEVKSLRFHGMFHIKTHNTLVPVGPAWVTQSQSHKYFLSTTVFDAWEAKLVERMQVLLGGWRSLVSLLEMPWKWHRVTKYYQLLEEQDVCIRVRMHVFGRGPREGSSEFWNGPEKMGTIWLQCWAGGWLISALWLMLVLHWDPRLLPHLSLARTWPQLDYNFFSDSCISAVSWEDSRHPLP